MGVRRRNGFKHKMKNGPTCLACLATSGSHESRKVESCQEIFSIFPESKREGLASLPFKCDGYNLWHDPDVNYSGHRLHVKIGNIKDSSRPT